MADPGLEAAISGDTPFVGNFTGTPSASNPYTPGTQVQLGNNAPVTPTDLTGISEAGAGPFNATIPGPGGDPLQIQENFPGGAMGTGAGGSPTGSGGVAAPAGTDIGSLGIGTPFGTQPGDAATLPGTFNPVTGVTAGPSSLVGTASGLPGTFSPGGAANTGNGGTSPGSSNSPERTPTSTSLSPFAGGDVGSFVQWYNNLDPSMATSLFTALQKAQAPAGAPQLTGPQPFTVGS